MRSQPIAGCLPLPILSCLPILSVDKARAIIVAVRRVIRFYRERDSVVLGIHDLVDLNDGNLGNDFKHLFDLANFACLLHLHFVLFLGHDSLLGYAFVYLYLAVLLNFCYLWFGLYLGSNREMPVVKRPMRQCVLRNLKIALEIFRGPFHNLSFQDIMENCRDVANTLVDGLTCNLQDTMNDDLQVIQFDYNLQDTMDDGLQIMQSCNHNLEDTKNMDAINCRYILDCAEAELAVVARLKKRTTSTGDATHAASRGVASRAFRSHFHTYTNDEDRFNALRQVVGANISDDLLRRLTSLDPNGISVSLRDSAATGMQLLTAMVKRRKSLRTSIERQPEELQPYTEELRVVVDQGQDDDDKPERG
ncbi:hypothetical protein EV421DRAFT_1801888 [Armillaria borealis]|uniref:Uncharacterized protein n=1 Tax=Armillaria borealis TaxID=47425 RepID=A0AA39MRZ0_9AGAR|nr:hypothetical protein EV421DRAFT_1801888 [Armillaria borealis]